MLNVKQVQAGSTAFVRATPFLFKNGLGIWYLAPVLLYFLLFGVSFFGFSAWVAPYVENWIAGHLNVNMPTEELNWWKTVLNFLAKSTVFLSGWVIKVFIFIALAKAMKYIILIIMSPILAYLS